MQKFPEQKYSYLNLSEKQINGLFAVLLRNAIHKPCIPKGKKTAFLSGLFGLTLCFAQLSRTCFGHKTPWQNCCLLCVWVGFLHTLPCHCQSKNTKIDMICRSLWNHCFRHFLTTVKTLSLNIARWKCMSVHVFILELDVS